MAYDCCRNKNPRNVFFGKSMLIIKEGTMLTIFFFVYSGNNYFSY
jgi:hypothetical protein